MIGQFGRCPRLIGEPALHRTGHEPGDRGLNGLAGVGNDVNVVLPVLAVHSTQLPEDHLGVGGEVLVDYHLTVHGYDRGERHPRLTSNLCTGEPLGQHQDVAHHIGARCRSKRPSGQSDRADQVGPFGHGLTSRICLGVQGESTGDDRDEAARSGEIETFHDEVVVDRMATGVVVRIVEGQLAEGDVPDHKVDGDGREPGLCEGLGADVGLGVEGRGDGSGHRVELDPGYGTAPGGEADEVAGPTPRLQHSSGGEPEVGDYGPHCFDHFCRGVVRVDGGAPRRVELPIGEEHGELCPGGRESGVGVVEYFGDRTPARPPGEGGLLFGACCSRFRLEQPQGA